MIADGAAAVTTPGARVAQRLLIRYRTEAVRERARYAPVEEAKRMPFVEWVTRGNFTADREPINLDEWRFQRPIYTALPKEPRDFGIVIQKAAQCGGSITTLFYSLYCALAHGLRIGYFLPTRDKAIEFSTDRFLNAVRDNPQIHRLLGDEDDPHARVVIDEGSARARRLLDAMIYFSWTEGKVTTEGTPLDLVCADEVQRMELGTLTKVFERVSGSKFKARLLVSTANFVGADINYFFDTLSDQRMFYTRCGGCRDGIVLAECWDSISGPSCIDRGNGTTPSVPTDWFYVCPRCTRIIPDAQDGEYRARLPENLRNNGFMGYQYPQMLSPRQTPKSILDKWRFRSSTRVFFNRVLGLPHSDPRTQPITDALLMESVNDTLRWEVPARRDIDGIFAGVDQMQHFHVVVVKALTKAGKQRIVHLEVVQDADPWKRTRAILDEYHVRFAAIEGLPNTDPAHALARSLPGRVYVVSYHEQDVPVRWADAQRDTPSDHRTMEEFRAPWRVTINQYLLMEMALQRFVRHEVEMPDARALTQRMITDQGEDLVPIAQDLFWKHLKHVALIVEEGPSRSGSKNDDSERFAERRRPRAYVKKIQIDPHFAYAWMLSEVAFARAYGTAYILGMGSDEDAMVSATPEAVQRRDEGLADQLRRRVPGLAQMEEFDAEDHPFTCADCHHFDAVQSFCKERRLSVKGAMRRCDEYFEQAEEEEKEWT